MARYLPCLLVKDEGGVPLLGGVPLVGSPGRRRGGWQMRRVLLVEDHAAFREALMTVLNMQPDLEVVGCAGALAEGRAALAP